MAEVQKLRELASWYREFADRVGNPSIWASRLQMAEDLEAKADQKRHVPQAWQAGCASKLAA